MRERLTRFFGQCAIGAYMVLSCAMVSCTQDNLHLPDMDTGTETWEVYTKDFPCHMTTTVPLVQEYLQGPVVGDMTVQVADFNTSHSGYVSIRTEAFGMDDPFVVGILGKAIEIGAMEIPQVEYAAYPSGGGYFRKEAFDIQAGEYRTRGSLFGEITKDGSLTLTLTYRPGTMPFDIVSEYKTR